MVDPDARIDRRWGRLGKEPKPSADDPAPGTDREVVSLGEVPRRRGDGCSIDVEGQLAGLQERSIDLRKPRRHLPRVEPSIDLADLDPDVSNAGVNGPSLVAKLVCPEPASIAVAVVLESGSALVTRSSRNDREAIAEMADRRLAALPEPADPLPGPLWRGAPSEVIPLQFGGPHARAADRGERDRPGSNGEVDPQLAAGNSRIDGVVDQLEQGVGR
ncbi:MAG TPA: hypothetical protein VIM30_01640 [Candidatus Limnocylindrales bacterium]